MHIPEVARPIGDDYKSSIWHIIHAHQVGATSIIKHFNLSHIRAAKTLFKMENSRSVCHSEGKGKECSNIETSVLRLLLKIVLCTYSFFPHILVRVITVLLCCLSLKHRCSGGSFLCKHSSSRMFPIHCKSFSSAFSSSHTFQSPSSFSSCLNCHVYILSWPSLFFPFFHSSLSLSFHHTFYTAPFPLKLAHWALAIDQFLFF